MGLGRGLLKRLLHRLWLSADPMTPADIMYGKLKLRLRPADNAIESKLLFGSKVRDHEEIRYLTEHLGPESTFIDIGANMGYYALVVAGCGTNRVFAVEPNPIANERLLFNIRANELEKSVTVLPVALGAVDGDVVLTIAAGDMGGSRINTGAASENKVKVPMMQLTQVLREQSITSVDGIKIDVEGMEDHILFPFFECAPRSLWPKFVIIEHTSSRDWKRDILSFMLSSGYKAERKTRSNTMLRLT